MSSSQYQQFDHYEIHEVSVAVPQTFRAGLYLFAKRHHLKAKAFIKWETFPLPTVVFTIGQGELPPLPGAPVRGRKSHHKDEQ